MHPGIGDSQLIVADLSDHRESRAADRSRFSALTYRQL